MDRINNIKGHFTGSRKNTIRSEPTSAIAIPSHQEDVYRFTLNNSRLTPEQRRHYEENGYIVIKKLVSREKLDRYKSRFQQICSKEVPPSPGLIIMKDVAIAKSEFVAGEKAVTKIQDFQHDDVMFEYCCLPEIVEYVECFTGPNIMAMHTMLINKPPDPGTKSSRHPMHQDLHYFPFRPADRIVCSWTAMEKVHRGNGCLVAVPGSHKLDLMEHGYPDWEGGVNKLYHGVKNYTPDQERVWLEMEEGDTVFFHPILLHGSGMNRTEGFRKAISCHYAASDCNYMSVTDTSQGIVQNEVTEIARKRIGSTDLTLNLEDIWRFRAKLVKGEQVNL